MRIGTAWWVRHGPDGMWVSKCHSQSQKVMEGHGGPWKVMEGHGRSWKRRTHIGEKGLAEDKRHSAVTADPTLVEVELPLLLPHADVCETGEEEVGAEEEEEAHPLEHPPAELVVDAPEGPCTYEGHTARRCEVGADEKGVANE